MTALYVRVSTPEQVKEGYSIDEQSDRLKKYAEAMGWDDFKLYVDAGYSGGNTDRPALQDLIADVRLHRIRRVIVYKLDRLSRSQLDTLYLIEKVFLENGCDFISMSESFDTSTPFGRAMIGILAVFAQLERAQIKERMNMGRDARAKEGLWHGGSSTPYGYKYKDGMLKIEVSEALQVQNIFQLYSEGYSVAKILEMLDDNTRSGRWCDKTLRLMLRNKTYIGQLRHNGEWHQGIHEPIISDKLFEDVNSLLDARRGKMTPKGSTIGRASYYLTGHLICAQCGAKYGTQHYKQKSKKDASITYHYKNYCCYSRMKVKDYLVKDENCKNRKWDVDELDAIIFDEIRKFTIDASELDQAIEDSSLTKIKAINDEIQKLQRQSDRLIELYAVEDISKAMLEDKLHGIQSKKDKLEEALTALEDSEAKKAQKKKELLSLEPFSDIIQRGDFKEIRALIDLLIDKIELDDDNITISWNF